MTTDVKKLRELLKAASPRPWKARDHLVYFAFPGLDGGFSLCGCPQRAENAALIAEGINALDALLDEVECLRQQNKGLIEQHDRDSATLREYAAARDAFKRDANLNAHKVIACGVAASHPDPNLSRTGAYAEKWDSPQAQAVRALRAERDRLREALEHYADRNNWCYDTFNGDSSTAERALNPTEGDGRGDPVL